MENNSTVMIDTLFCVIASVLKKWKIILICMVVCGIGFDVVKTFTYKEEFVSSISVSLKEEDSYSHYAENIDYAKTVGYIFESNVVGEYIAESMGMESMPGRIETTLMGDTSIMKISAYSNAVSNSYRMIHALEDWFHENKNLLSNYQMSIVERETVNETPINYNSHSKNFFTGSSVVGIFLLVLYVLIFYFRDSVKSADNFTTKVNSRLLGRLPYEFKEDKLKGIKSALLISDLRTSFAYTESVKKLCNRLVASAEKHDYKTFLFTSSVENEGKSSVTTNIALALAKRGNKVLLIDGDMRKPAIKKIFNLKHGNVGKVLRKEGKMSDEFVYLEKQKLFVLGSDVVDVRDHEYEKEWEELIARSKKIFDYVIVDSAPCRFISDTLLLSSICDATVMVVKQNEAPSKVINDTIYRLQSAHANLIGCVYNASVYSVRKTITSSSHYGGRNVYKRLSGRES